MKPNADGALAHRSGAGGAVLRDSHGDFVAGACHFSPGVADAEVAELLACRRAITLAKEINVQKVILETDTQVAARKVLGDQKDLPANGQLVEEIKVLLGSFEEFKVAWV